MPTPTTSKNAKKVAIIGAGVSGLCAAKYLLEERLASAANPNQEIFEVVIFEQNSQAGGVWNLTGSDDQFATPMYPACRSIVPIDLLQYSGISYDEDTALFPKNPSVAKYLLGYAHNLETRGLIRYKTEVLNVSRQTTPAPDQMTWRVKTCEYGISGREELGSEDFDFLVLALGTFTEEFIPPLFKSPEAGIEILHSKKYRNADRFASKRVLIVGDGPASREMARAILKVCQGNLFISVTDKEKYENQEVLPNNLIVFPEATRICYESKEVHFKDARQRNVDIVLLCTGYKYDFGIFPGVQMTEGNKRVLNLYEHMLLIDEDEDPTVAFVGLPTMGSVFLIAEAQSAFIARYFSGRIRIPTAQLKNERDTKAKDFDSRVARKEMKNGQFHTLNYPKDAEYVDELFRKCVEAEDAESIGTEAIRTQFNKSAGEIAGSGFSTDESSWWLHWILDCIPIAFMSSGETTGVGPATLESLGFEFDESAIARSDEERENLKCMKGLQDLMKEKNKLWQNYREWELAADEWKERWYMTLRP